jgi:ribosome-associated toxin RatA of RatAB toxin-antitoxin module
MVMVQALLTMVAALAATVVFASPADEPQISVVETGGVYRVTAAFTVAAPSATVAAVLTDYERIPQFMPDVKTSQVRSRTDAGLVVEQEATAKFMMFSKKIHLMLEVSEDGGTIRFRDRCGKSFDTYEGAWRLTDAGGKTQVVYELSAKPAFEVPAFVLKRLLKRDAAVLIERLTAEIVGRAEASK